MIIYKEIDLTANDTIEIIVSPMNSRENGKMYLRLLDNNFVPQKSYELEEYDAYQYVAHIPIEDIYDNSLSFFSWMSIYVEDTEYDKEGNEIEINEEISEYIPMIIRW